MVDKIVGRKARFRTTAVKTGTVISDIGANSLIFAPLFDNVSGAQAIAGGISIIGVTAMAIGQAAKPHADTRYWKNLPDTIHTYSANLTPGKHTVTIRYLDKNKVPIKKMETTKSVTIVKEKQNLIWNYSR